PSRTRPWLVRPAHGLSSLAVPASDGEGLARMDSYHIRLLTSRALGHGLQDGPGLVPGAIPLPDTGTGLLEPPGGRTRALGSCPRLRKPVGSHPIHVLDPEPRQPADLHAGQAALIEPFLNRGRRAGEHPGCVFDRDEGVHWEQSILMRIS